MIATIFNIHIMINVMTVRAIITSRPVINKKELFIIIYIQDFSSFQTADFFQLGTGFFSTWRDVFFIWRLVFFNLAAEIL